MSFESVSIIMPAYNAAKYISHSITSVLSQSYGDWRLYIVDDASTDDTANVVADIHDDRIEYILLKDNGGVANARNVGIQRSQGKYIAFLDSDDLWEKTKLEKQVALLEQGYMVVCGNYSTFLSDIGNPVSVRTSPSEFNYTDMLSCNRIGNLTGIYNRHVLGTFYQERCGHEDYLMWLSIMKVAKKAACVQEVIALYRLSANSLSANKLNAAKWQWHIYRNKLLLSLPDSLYYWLRYVVIALGRKVFN
ncbi:glycosyltransferase family 2 protein [Aeromonas sp. BIGb0445]|uniref:glycosyltransferase family 2 protein n=1 Tax=Aeromonas sp. BIGb0445 TaxID=2940593 RepID=UPI002166FE38|nr:glycosyltransferase family 2 protein [Aeromonas sp. BIGb0445]MCS3458389.1 glycosyltransferase involved in cell wall biosynthesis [Aeromonas sp. BIGb0445]